ncbi:MAG: hypothetical protein EHM36_03230, partial [Deltaproteobacteria bacterium]
MIKINLLLARKEKKKVGIKREGVVLILSVVVLVLLLGGVQWKMSSDKADLTARIEGKKKEIARFKALTAEVSKAKDDQKSLQEKLNVINTLK